MVRRRQARLTSAAMSGSSQSGADLARRAHEHGDGAAWQLFVSEPFNNTIAVSTS